MSATTPTLMPTLLHLTITTPAAVLVDDAAVLAVRAEDGSGSFGILPGHTGLLTVLTPSVVRWRSAGGATRYCAVDGGVMTVSAGATVAIACREGTLGDDLDRLRDDVAALRAAQADAGRKARVEEMRLHARAVRQLMRYMRPGSGDLIEVLPSAGGDGE